MPRAADDVEAFSAAAAEGGLEHVVLLSGRGEEGAVASEERLRRAPIDHTILRASWFSQNFSEGAFLDGILAGELTLPADKIAEPFVSVDDVADVALEALCNPAHRNQSYELTGPRLLTFADAVAEIAAASGRDIRYRAVPAGAFLADLRQAGFDEQLVWLLEDLFIRTLDGRNAKVMPGHRDHPRSQGGRLHRVRPPNLKRGRLAESARTGVIVRRTRCGQIPD